MLIHIYKLKLNILRFIKKLLIYFFQVNLASALRTARSTFSASRAGVKKIVLLLNYKYPTIEVDRVSLEATFIKEQADIITVGIIPPRNKDESITLLKDIATSSTTHYHSALDFTHLNDFLYDIINDVCLISTAHVITTTTTTTTTTTITTTTPIKRNHIFHLSIKSNV